MLMYPIPVVQKVTPTAQLFNDIEYCIRDFGEKILIMKLLRAKKKSTRNDYEFLRSLTQGMDIVLINASNEHLYSFQKKIHDCLKGRVPGLELEKGRFSYTGNFAFKSSLLQGVGEGAFYLYLWNRCEEIHGERTRVHCLRESIEKALGSKVKNAVQMSEGELEVQLICISKYLEEAHELNFEKRKNEVDVFTRCQNYWKSIARIWIENIQGTAACRSGRIVFLRSLLERYPQCHSLATAAGILDVLLKMTAYDLQEASYRSVCSLHSLLGGMRTLLWCEGLLAQKGMSEGSSQMLSKGITHCMSNLKEVCKHWQHVSTTPAYQRGLTSDEKKSLIDVIDQLKSLLGRPSFCSQGSRMASVWGRVFPCVLTINSIMTYLKTDEQNFCTLISISLKGNVCWANWRPLRA